MCESHYVLVNGGNVCVSDVTGIRHHAGREKVTRRRDIIIN